jgi:hypothetical protein
MGSSARKPSMVQMAARVVGAAALVIGTVLAISHGVAGATTPPDPGTSGPDAVTTGFYDLGDTAFTVPASSGNTFASGVEVVGEVDYPSDITSMGSLPIVLIMHGDHVACYDPSTEATENAWPCPSPYEPIPSYQGFHYLAQALAGEGMVVVSISTNGIEAQEDSDSTDGGISARAELAEYTLQILSDWNASSTGPFGSTLVGHLNLADVGVIGHSRGGGAVADLVSYNASQPSPFGIKAVELLSPFWNPGLDPNLASDVADVPVLDMESYCDGNNPPDPGVAYTDLTRYPGDSAPHSVVWVMGGNHFYWDTVQTSTPYPAGLPSVQDDWTSLGSSYASDPWCGSSSPDRLSPTGQQSVAAAYSRTFMGEELLGDSAYAPYLEGTTSPPPSAGTDNLLVDYIPAAAQRLVVNSFANASSLSTDDLGQPVAVAAGGGSVSLCGPATTTFCATGPSAPAEEPETTAGMVQQAHVSWSGPGTSITSDLGGPTDLTGATILVRAGVDFGAAQSAAPDFSVQLTDANGNTAEADADASPQPIDDPPGDSVDAPGILPRETLQTIAIPVSAFTGIDASEVTKIGLVFDRTSEGSMMTSDLMVTDLPSPPPSTPEAGDAVILPVLGMVVVGAVALGWRRRNARAVAR